MHLPNANDPVQYEKLRRSEVGERTWDQLQKDPFLMGIPDFIFADAILSFKGGAYTASVLSCGASLESAVYHAVTREPKSENKFALEINFDFIHSNWGELLSRAKEIRVVDPATEGRIEYVRKMSNFAGRQAQQFDETVKRDLAKGPLRGLTWVDFSQSEKVLDETVHALNSIRSNFESKRKPKISFSTLRRKLGFVRDTVVLIIGASLVQLLSYNLPWTIISPAFLVPITALAVVLRRYRRKLFKGFQTYAFKSFTWSLDQLASLFIATGLAIMIITGFNWAGIFLFGILVFIGLDLEFLSNTTKKYQGQAPN